MVQNRDHNNKTVQMVTRSHFGASIGLSLLRSESYILQADNELASSRIILELYHLELFNDGYYYIKNFIVIFIERYSYSLKIPTHYMIHPLVDVDWTRRKGKADQTHRSQFFTEPKPRPV